MEVSGERSEWVRCALGADRSGSVGFAICGAAIPASGSVLGADHDFGDYAVLTGRVARGSVLWVVGAIAASHFEPHALVFACSVLFLGLICALLRSDQTSYRFSGITLAIVMLVPRARPAWQIALHRLAEVSIGIGVALVLTFVWPEREVALPNKT